MEDWFRASERGDPVYRANRKVNDAIYANALALCQCVGTRRFMAFGDEKSPTSACEIGASDVLGLVAQPPHSARRKPSWFAPKPKEYAFSPLPRGSRNHSYGRSRRHALS